MNYQKSFKVYKTEPCKKCKDQDNPFPSINYFCQYYHNEDDKRRNPFVQKYFGVFVENNYASNYCKNYVEYLYHPDNYRTTKCSLQNCKLIYSSWCPFYHNNKQMVEKKVKLNEYSKMLDELYSFEKQIIKSDESSKINQTRKNIQIQEVVCNNIEKKANNISNKQYPLDVILDNIDSPENPNNNLIQLDKNIRNISDIDIDNKRNFEQHNQNYQIIYKQEKSPQHYFYGQQVPFFQDRKHQFKAFVKINFSTLIPLIFEYMCAFLNCEGGTLYVGIDDNAYIRGVKLYNKEIDKMLLQIDAGCKSKFSPPVMPIKYSVHFIPVMHGSGIRLVKDLYVIEIKIKKNQNQLYLYNRQCYMRMNASTHKLLASQIIENQRIKYQKKLSIQMQLQNAILKGQTQYYELKSADELKELKRKLQSNIQVISKLLKEK